MQLKEKCPALYAATYAGHGCIPIVCPIDVGIYMFDKTWAIMGEGKQQTPTDVLAIRGARSAGAQQGGQAASSVLDQLIPCIVSLVWKMQASSPGDRSATSDE